MTRRAPLVDAVRATLERWHAARSRSSQPLGALAEQPSGEQSLADQPCAEQSYAVAFSGGLDSTVLLNVLARLQVSRLRALHVDHGIHPDSARWEAHCRAAAASLGVPYESLRVEVPRASGQGLEAAARDARYAALASRLGTGELLLTAHHADDQLETLLLRMLRGSGVRGMRGIAELAPCGAGRVGRPLLGWTRAELAAAAAQWQLDWLEDPANRDPRHDRSYLRSEVVPRVVRRWPSAAHAASGLAARMRDAEEILEATAAADLTEVGDLARLPRAVLEALSPARRRNALRHALRSLGLPLPSAARIDDLCTAALTARPDAKTRLAWPGGEARVYRACLYLFAPLPAPSAGLGARLAARDRWCGPEGTVDFAPVDAPGLPEEWVEAGLDLRFRKGGERFRPLGRDHGAPLKHWFQEAGVVPWLRDRVPLLYRGAELVAVGDLWVTASVTAAPGARRYAVRWTGHPPLY